MIDEYASRVVGAVVLTVLAWGVIGLVALEGTSLHSRLRVELYFTNVGTLEEGTDIQQAGRVIGEVETIRLVRAADAQEPDHPLAGASGVVVTAAIDEQYAARAAINSEFFIAFKGILGKTFVEVGPAASGAPPERAIADGDRVRGVDPPLLDQVLLRSFYNLTSSRRFVRAVAPEARRLVAAARDLADTLAQIEPTPGAYGQLRGRLGDVVIEIEALSETLGGAGLGELAGVGDRATDTLAAVRAELGDLRRRIDRLAAAVAARRDRIPPDLAERFRLAAKRADESVAKLESITTEVQSIMAAVDRGEGTVGALLNDPEFIDDAKKLGKIIKRQPWRVIGRPRD